jgi:hypothetical protein
MALSVIPARLEYACGHAALVTLPSFRGEGSRLRSRRVEAQKSAAALRPCDFCPPSASLAPSDSEEVGLLVNGSAAGSDETVAVKQEPLAAPVEIRNPELRKQRTRSRSDARDARRAALPELSTSRRRRATSSGRIRQRDRARVLEFRVRYEGEMVLEARDVRDALRQAEALGALDVTRIVRIG